jgi:hypothetical protein
MNKLNDLIILKKTVLGMYCVALHFSPEVLSEIFYGHVNISPVT